jgi:dTDP-4-amino-4,6-dideoxygalactose transaminase
MRDNMLVFGAPNLGEAEIDGVVAVMKSGWLGTGPKVAQLEQDFARYKEASHAVPADIESASLNIGPLQIAKKLTSKTKAILSVHFSCGSVNMDALCTLAKAHNLDIIEDCAHADEAGYRGRRGVLSFYDRAERSWTRLK